MELKEHQEPRLLAIWG